MTSSDPAPELLGGARRAGLYAETERAPDAPSNEPAASDLPAHPRQEAPPPTTAPEPTPAPAPAPAPARTVVPVSGVVAVAPADASPAQWGWRFWLRRCTGGLLRLGPDETELAHRKAITTIRQATWPRAVNIFVGNPKGGSGKTPTALILAGILGDVRGGYVVAFEAAESRGSLSRRAEGDPLRGLAELLNGVADIRSAGNIGGYTAPQTSNADVIGSVKRRAVLTLADVLALRRVLDVYYRITVTDSGNNPGHEAFIAALQTADAVLLPCLVSIDALAGVEEVLEVMRASGGHVAAATGLISRVVVVLTHDGGPEDPAIAAALQQRLHQLGVSAVVEVPFDAAIRRGGEITLSALSRESTRAWTAAAAAVVQALRSAPTETDLVQQLQLDTFITTRSDLGPRLGREETPA